MLSFGNIKSIIVLQDFNKIIIHDGSDLVSYSLEVLARVAQYQAPASSLDASLETIAEDVLCCQAGQMGDRTIRNAPLHARRIYLKNIVSSCLCRQELLTSHCPCDGGLSPF